jgi:hypothetical protein
MMQQKRPISRSSTPIEFAPLILDLEPEVKEEPKNKRGTIQIIAIAVGIVVVLGTMAYFIFRSEGAEQVDRTINAGRLEMTANPIVAQKENKRTLAHSAKNAKMTLENRDGQDVLRVLLQDKGEGITWVYEWTKNDQPYGKGDTVKGFKRGDIMAVKISPFDGENYGEPRTLSMVIKNTVPQVIEDKAGAFDGKQFTYQVKASDADGDSLTFSLAEGPQGMVIDSKSGMITWSNIPESLQEVAVKVKIVDGHGGDLLYPITVNLPKPTKENMTAQK